MKTKMITMSLILSMMLIGYSCKKEKETPKSVKITKITVQDFKPETKDGEVPDIYCKIYDTDDNLIYSSETLENVATEDLPKSFTYNLPLSFTDFQKTYTLKLYDMKTLWSDVELGDVKIDFTKNTDYPDKLDIDNPSDELNIDVAIKWIY